MPHFILHMALSSLSSFHIPELQSLASLMNLQMEVFDLLLPCDSSLPSALPSFQASSTQPDIAPSASSTKSPSPNTAPHASSTKLDTAPRSADTSRPLIRVWLPSLAQAEQLASRCISIHSISQLLAFGLSDSGLLCPVPPIAPDDQGTFKFDVRPVLRSVTPAQTQAAMRSAFELLRPAGSIDLVNPSRTFPIFITDSHRLVCRFVASGQRALLSKFSLKTRQFIGNTSMAAEESLLVASLVQAAPGRFILDPFVGTGSLLYPCAHWGATVMGADIDGRQFRGAFGDRKFDEGRFGIKENTKVYEQRDKWADCIVQDLKNCDGFRPGVWDGIVADPPYGVRAGAKTVGRVVKSRSVREVPEGPLPPHLPSFRPYPLEELVMDLIVISHRLLNLGGRLTFFLPTTSEDFSIEQLPEMPGMALTQGVAEQCFGKWTRRLITFEKTSLVLGTNAERTDANMSWTGFRDKYFDGFKS